MNNLNAKNSALCVKSKRFAESSSESTKFTRFAKSSANSTQNLAKKPLRIAFFGTPLFAKNILESFVANPNCEIIALITQEDKPFGRKRELKAPETKVFLRTHNPQIPIFQPQKVGEILDDLRALKPNIAIVVAYGRILPKIIIDEFCCINIHASILPKYRGASPISAMILSAEEFLGVSVIKMSEKLDSGDILGVSAIKNRGENMSEAIALLSQMGANLAIKVLARLDFIAPLAQISADASYCHKLTKRDGIVRFSDARAIFLKSLAYQLYPQIATERGLKLFGVTINEAESSNRAGEILEVRENAVVVGCERGSIIVESLQAVGKNKVRAVDYLNGARLGVGEILR